MTRSDPCRLIVHGPCDGAWNMAVDELLLESAAGASDCCFRFYQWSVPTLSLGYFQSFADRLAHPASRDCLIVRRSTGGGAILHDRELTYSITVPRDHRLASDALTLYQRLHGTLIRALARRNTLPTMCDAQSASAARQTQFLCFQRRSEGDLLIGEYKIAGSAQRRRRGAILQHGSVLLNRAAAAPELAGVNDIAAQHLAPAELRDGWLIELAAAFELRWRRDELTAAEQQRVAQIVAEKHGNRAWIERR